MRSWRGKKRARAGGPSPASNATEPVAVPPPVEVASVHCSVTGCSGPAAVKGMCWSHYRQVRRGKAPRQRRVDTPKEMRSVDVRFTIQQWVVDELLKAHAEAEDWVSGLVWADAQRTPASYEGQEKIVRVAALVLTRWAMQRRRRRP